MNKLTSANRKYLRSLAHHIEPVVLIGKNGINNGVINSIEIALNSKELIKIKFRDFKDQKKKLSKDIERDTESNIVGIIGNILILYKKSDDPDKIKIQI
tara:strand:+ start:4005 stop:4301 length:297 start_codon:yes stop_codon:yes gene_type:complete